MSRERQLRRGVAQLREVGSAPTAMATARGMSVLMGTTSPGDRAARRCSTSANAFAASAGTPGLAALALGALGTFGDFGAFGMFSTPGAPAPGGAARFD